MPSVFFVPIRYDFEDTLSIKKELILQQQYSYISDFANKIKNNRNAIIGLSLPTQREEKWVKDKEAMEKCAESKGIPLRIENADTDAAKQASQVDKLISQGINVLILAPVDSSNSASMVEKAHKAGVKVIDYERLIENSDSDLYVSFNSMRVGELQGQYLIRNVPKGNYIIMSGDPRDYNSRLLKEGAMEYIAPLVIKRDIKIVADEAVINWDPKNAFKIVTDSLIANNNKIDAILAPNDATAGAAIEALQKQGLAGKVAVTGQDADLDAIKRILQGTQSMTVFKDPRELGRTAIEAAIKLANREAVDVNGEMYNGKINVPSILLAPIAVDKNNIDSVLINSGYLKKEEVYQK
jgi:D-xylose transport system substrate-binding protein